MAEENILKVLSESLKIQLMSWLYKPRDLTSEKQLLPKFLSFYKVTLNPVSWLPVHKVQKICKYSQEFWFVISKKGIAGSPAEVFL